MGLVGEPFDVFPGGDAGEDQDGFHAGFHTSDYVRIHPVSDHDRIFRMDPQPFQAGPHHEGVGFADEIGFFPSGQFDGSDERPAGGDDPPVAGAGHVTVGADELGSFMDQFGGLDDHLIIVAGGFAHHHIFRVHIIIGDAGIIEGIHQPMGPDEPGAWVFRKWAVARALV